MILAGCLSVLSQYLFLKNKRVRFVDLLKTDFSVRIICKQVFFAIDLFPVVCFPILLSLLCFYYRFA
jgi:hypothetical protein